MKKRTNLNLRVTKRIIINARDKQDAFEKALTHPDLVKESGERILIDRLFPFGDPRLFDDQNDDGSVQSDDASEEKVFLIRKVEQ